MAGGKVHRGICTSRQASGCSVTLYVKPAPKVVGTRTSTQINGIPCKLNRSKTVVDGHGFIAVFRILPSSSNVFHFVTLSSASCIQRRLRFGPCVILRVGSTN